MTNVEQHFELLGKKVKDKVSGFAGVVNSICFDLFGCIQASVAPPMDAQGKLQESYWFDVTRLTVVSEKPVMQLPDFNKGYVAEGKKGPAIKPARKY